MDRGEHITVNDRLQVPGYPNIFVIGDQACVIGKDGRPMPGTVPQAEDNARYVTYALTQVLKNLNPKPHVTRKVGYIIPLGGKWMILKSGPIYVTGYLAYIIRQFVFLRYFIKVLGVWGGIKLILLETELYSRND
jgi:NADH dehydrogenase